MKTVVIGFGNILMGDEGVGVHIIQELQQNYSSRVKTHSNTSRHSIEFIDGGTSAIDVLLSVGDVDKLIIIDAVKKGGKPGDVYRIHSNFAGKTFGKLEKNNTSMHDLGIIEALRISGAIDQIPKEIILIGVEPKEIEPKMELSAEVKKEIPKIMKVILSELEMKYGSLSTEIH